MPGCGLPGAGAESVYGQRLEGGCTGVASFQGTQRAGGAFPRAAGNNFFQKALRACRTRELLLICSYGMRTYQLLSTTQKLWYFTLCLPGAVSFPAQKACTKSLQTLPFHVSCDIMIKNFMKGEDAAYGTEGLHSG